MKSKPYVVFLFILILGGRGEAMENKGFFHDLSPLVGDGGWVRGIANNAGAFTGNSFDTEGNAAAFVWTREKGLATLPAPEGGYAPRGMLVSEDGRIVAGLAVVKGMTTDANAKVDGAVVWGQSDEPVFSDKVLALGAHITGISPDGTLVTGYSTLGYYAENKETSSLEYKGVFNALAVSGGNFYYLGGLYPEGSKAGDYLLALGSDGKTCLMGQRISDGKYAIDTGGEKRRDYGLGDIPREFPEGYAMGGCKLRSGYVYGLRAQAINADGSVAGGQLVTIEPATEKFRYFPVYWDADGKINFMLGGCPRYETEYSVDSVSDDGDTMLLSKDNSVALWRKGKGITKLADVFKEHGISTGPADASFMTFVRMSRDGQCFSGRVSHGRNDANGHLYKPFVACIGDGEPLFK